MNNDNEKNIKLTLVQNEESDSGVTITFKTIFRQFKRVLALWIVLAVVSAFVTIGSAVLFNKTVKLDNVTSLVAFNYDGISSGLAPDGSKFDINKIKAPSIIETALTNLDESLELVEPIRRNISIEGIVPSEALDKISLYQGVYSEGGTSAIQAVEALLDIGYYPSYYIVKFDNNTAEIELDTAKKVINEMLNVYQEYFFKTYQYNKALGNSIVAVDYTEYDYPAAVDIFKSILDELDTYTRRLAAGAPNTFRSTTTGYSFDDIRRKIDLIRTAELDAVSAYITINNVTNDREQLITYYNYKIEELERDKAVYESNLKSISNSIDEYEKDSLLIFGDSGSFDETNYSQVSEKYDQLIERKISAQEDYSTVTQNIEYYKIRLETFEKNKSANTADMEYVDECFAKLYDKVVELIDITTKTSDEYYENIVFANAFNILVPATGDEGVVQINGMIFPVIIVEAVLVFGFIVYVFVSAIVIDSKKNKIVSDDDSE